VVPESDIAASSGTGGDQDIFGSVHGGLPQGDQVCRRKPQFESSHSQFGHSGADPKNEGSGWIRCVSADRQVYSPRRFPVNKIIVIISGGAVQSISKPKGIALEIRDYDVEGDDFPENNQHFQRDDHGNWFQRMYWSEDQVEG
jgi:hypothetical protein